MVQSQLYDNIQYFVQNSYINFNKTIYSEWLNNVAKNNSYSILLLNYVFISEAEMLRLNIKTLGHHYLTDILTFDLSGTDQMIEGDIYICPIVVKENALTYKQKYHTELRRVMVHGLLHLLGEDDKTQLQQQKMRIQEDSALKLYTNKYQVSRGTKRE